jgi:hypothetical protein
MVLVFSGFHTRERVFQKIIDNWVGDLKIFASHVLGRKTLKNIGLKRRQFISLPGHQNISLFGATNYWTALAPNY